MTALDTMSPYALVKKDADLEPLPWRRMPSVC